MFDWLLGSSKSAEKVIDTGCGLLETAASGVDMMFYTDEERALAKTKAYELWLKTQETIRDENSIRSVTRRIIAVAFTAIFLFLCLSGVALALITNEPTNPCFKMVSEISTIEGMIIVFYFGPTMIGRAISSAKKE